MKLLHPTKEEIYEAQREYEIYIHNLFVALFEAIENNQNGNAGRLLDQIRYELDPHFDEYWKYRKIEGGTNDG